MSTADICIIVEGGYPYTMGGVASWLDAFVKSFPHLNFHVVAIVSSATKREIRYPAPPNVIAVQDINIDQCPTGRAAQPSDRDAILSFAAHIQRLLTNPDAEDFYQLVKELRAHGLRRRALLDSRIAWQGMETAYNAMAPNAPLVDFFWTWRNFACGIIALAAAPMPKAKIYHTTSTGYSGVFGACAKGVTGRPMIITEHGIYTNERRIEIAVADWLYASGAGGFGVSLDYPELHDLWLSAFRNFSVLAYEAADIVTTQYRDNQAFQRKDGCPPEKQRLIPNGIDVTELVRIEPDPAPHRPTIALLGRVVPIKDTRTFIMAAAALRRTIPNLEALIIGPEDEDKVYAADCRALVQHERLGDIVKFVGRVPELRAFFPRIDILVMTSISEAQPLVLLEAGAAGLPAMTTDVGSCREIIEGLPEDGVEGHGGMVVPACDPQAAADALAVMLSDEVRRRQMAIAMRKRIVSYYNRTRVDGLYEALYQPYLAAAIAAAP